MHVTIDARMAEVSGIGTYIREVVPRVIASWPDARFTLLGDPRVLGALVDGAPAAAVRACDAPIYSLREQAELPRLIPGDTTLYWAPHYNIPLLYRGRMAVTVHDVNHLALPQPSRLRQAYASALFGAVRRRAQLVLCDSHFTAAEFARLVGPPRSSEVVHLGVSARWFAIGDAPPLAGPYFLYVGNVKPHKNLVRLVEAFAAIAAGVPHRLVIVGQREGMRNGDDAAARVAESLGDRVLFTGAVSQSMLEAYIAGCDGLVLPSLYEGFGLPPLEALACGRAVAVSASSSLPEVCGPEAEYFDPTEVASIGAALGRLARRPPDTEETRERRRAWARGFDWDRCAARTSAALRRAAG